MKKKKRDALIALTLVFSLVLTVWLTTTVQAQGIAKQLTGADYTTTLTSGHYYINGDVTYSAGISIPSGNTVYIDVPEGSTLTCNGQDAYHKTVTFWLNQSYEEYGTSTAGITVEPGATLHLTGNGDVVVKGGDGSSAQEGESGLGYEVTCTYVRWLFKDNVFFAGGSGGKGGSGAYAPSAAIGGTGGAGGQRTNSVGAPTDKILEDDGVTNVCKVGSPGRDGNVGSDGSDMGDVYIEGTLNVTATAGGGDYKDAKGSTNFTDPLSIFKGGNGWTVVVSAGAPGGGGGGATDAAIIGGGGAGGGGGASGASGGYWALKSGSYSTNNTYYGGTAGSGTTGGDGGRTKQPNAKSEILGGKGGEGGTSGSGGTLYLTETASVNGKTAANLQQTDLGAVTNDTSGQGATVQRLTRVEMTLDLDEAAYTGCVISLQSEGLNPIELSESETTPGLYFGYVPTGNRTFAIYVNDVDTDYTLTANTAQTVTKNLRFHACEVDVTLDDGNYGTKGEHTVQLMHGTRIRAELTEESSTGVFKANVVEDINGNDTYAIYVDGVDYGKTFVVEKDAKVSAPFYTMTVKIKLNDDGNISNLGGQLVNLYLGNQYIARMEETTIEGTYQVVVAGENDSGIVSYTIGVGDDRCIEPFKAETGAERVVEYYNISVTLKNDSENWSGQIVSLVGNDTVLNMTEDGASGVYKICHIGDDVTDYVVTIGGVPSSGRIQVTEENKRSATVGFVTVTVNLTKDSIAWTDGASVMLKQNGKTAYILEKNGDSFTRKGIDAGTYDVYVYGADSEANTGLTVDADHLSILVDYYTITYRKNLFSDDSGDKVQIYQGGTTPILVSAAYQLGYTFLGWKVGATADSDDYVPEPITAPVCVYASWVSPKVTLGKFVRCDESGTISTNGTYFRFYNLSIEGYPTTGDVITTMTITLENVKLTTEMLPNGWKNVGVWDNGTGNGNYIFQVDTGKKLTVAEAQNYLRSLVFERNTTSGTCSVQISVFGSTN